MADETPPPDDATPPAPDTPPVDGTPAAPDLGDAGKKALAEERAAKKAAVQQAKTLQAELDKLKQAAMSDQEKAIADAVTAAKAETLAEVGGKIAASEFKAAAAGRLDDKQLTTLLSGPDLKAFLGDDGDVDGDKVRSFVDSVAPKPADMPDATPGDLLAGLDLGQGTRGNGSGGSAPGLGTTAFERDLRAKLNIH